MAKILHNDSTKTVNQIYDEARESGIMHLKAISGAYSNKVFKSQQSKELLNFGSLSYLGIDRNPKVIERAQGYLLKNGCQSVMSRTYVEPDYIFELESKLSILFGKKVLTYPRTTMAHLSVIPSIMKREDLLIYDQLSHFSMQISGKTNIVRGGTVEMIRHNDMIELEDILKKNSGTYRKIWYLADGVYSMHGDYAPLETLEYLLEKYPNLYLYIDDAHGISWTGLNGTGYVWNKFKGHSRVVLIATLAKGFGAHGGIVVFPNEEIYNEVQTFGGALSYSLPMSPADVGAAIGATEIHLSGEVETLQQKLAGNIKFFTEKIQDDLPFINLNLNPIFFMGLGKKEYVTFFTQRLIDKGIYVNPSIFPAVPATKCGLRIGISTQHTIKDLTILSDKLRETFCEFQIKYGVNKDSIIQSFKGKKSKNRKIAPLLNKYSTELYTSIEQVNKDEWNSVFGDKGAFDFDGLKAIEVGFKGNKKIEMNWEFFYLIVRDKNMKVVFSTFLTLTVLKNDFLAPIEISKKMEEKRKETPLYFSSLTLTMGSLMTEGIHYYLDDSLSKNNEILDFVFDFIEQLQRKVKASNLLLRDFERDNYLSEYFKKRGYAQITFPNSNQINLLENQTIEQHFQKLSKRSRKHFNDNVLANEKYFEVKIKQKISTADKKLFYQLFLNVKNRNLAINAFDYPEKVLDGLSNSDSWEFIVLYLKKDKGTDAVCSMWCHKSKDTFSGMVIGMDYERAMKFSVYRQALYQSFVRAKALKVKKIHWGFSADLEKKRMGAIQYARVGYMQSVDNYQFDMLNLLE